MANIIRLGQKHLSVPETTERLRRGLCVDRLFQ